MRIVGGLTFSWSYDQSQDQSYDQVGHPPMQRCDSAITSVGVQGCASLCGSADLTLAVGGASAIEIQRWRSKFSASGGASAVLGVRWRYHHALAQVDIGSTYIGGWKTTPIENLVFLKEKKLLQCTFKTNLFPKGIYKPFNLILSFEISYRIILHL